MKNDFLHVVDKEWGHHSYYYKHVMGLTISYDIQDNAITMKEARLYDGDEVDSFSNVDDLFSYLEAYTHAWTRETQLIYVDDLSMAKGLFAPYIDNEFKTIKTVFSLNAFGTKIEFRDIKGFIQDIATAKKDLDIDEEDCIVLQRYGQKLMEMFIEEGFVYISVYQKLRKNLHKSWKKSGVILEEDSYYKYNLLTKAKRGGLCFIHWPRLEITEPILGIDRTSAYPCDLLLEKYPMSSFEVGRPWEWRTYMDDNFAIFGVFEISYEGGFDSYFTSVYADNDYCLPYGYNRVTLVLTDIDIQILEKVLDVKSITCKNVFVAEKDYLPDYITDEIIKRYKAKSELKSIKDAEWKYRQTKLELNAFTGNLQRKLKSQKEYKNRDKAVNPAWGVWLTAYGRYHLIDLALQLDDKFYGDTDSIFCDDFPRNRERIANHNLQQLQKVKKICELRGWDIEVLHDLGKFEIEHTITHLFASKQKQYGYITTDGDEIVKCSGYERGSISYEQLKSMQLPQPNIVSYGFYEDVFGVHEITREEYLSLYDISEYMDESVKTY